MLFDFTATGRYYKVYRDGLYASQHTTEREAAQAATGLAFEFPDSHVTYKHEYEVEVVLTDAGVAESQDYAPTDVPPTIGSTPAPVFTVGTAASYDMTQHVSDDGQSTVTYAIIGTLPNGLTFNTATGQLSYDGLGAANVSSHQLRATDSAGSATSASFNVSIQAVSDAWADRSTAPGVLFATRFDSIDDVTNGRFPDPQQSLVSYETGNVASGAGSLRFDQPASSGADLGNWVAQFLPDGTGRGKDETFYVQFRQYIPQSYRDTIADGSSEAGKGGGWKQCIISAASSANSVGSNQVNEIVLQNTLHRGIVQGYNRDTGGNYPPWDTGLSTPCGTDFVYQNAVDATPGVTPSTCLEARRKYGGLFLGFPSQSGSPDPETAAFHYYTDEWLTFYLRITPGDEGVNADNTKIDVWCARDGDATYTHLFDMTVDTGNGPAYNAVWLTPFHTARSSNSVDTYTLYDEIIVSTNPIAVPPASVGAPTALAQLLATMSSNSWSAFNTTGLTPSLIEPGDSQVDTFFNQAKWNPIDKKVVAICQAHGTTYDSRELEWDDATNAWSPGPTPPVPSGQANQSHGYYMNAVDPVTGDRYWHRYASHTQYRKPRGGSWSTIASDLLDSTSFSVGFEFNPAIGTEGGLIAVSVYGISQWDKASEQSTQLEPLNTNYGDGDVGSCYDPRSQAIYWTGGGGVDRAFWQIAADGTVTRKADVPSYVGVSSAGIRVSMLVDGSRNHGPAHIDMSTGVVSEYNVATDTWAQVSTVPAAVLNAIDNDNLYWHCAINDEERGYDCVKLIYGTGATRSAHIWNR